jgi:hypothetical protein
MVKVRHHSSDCFLEEEQKGEKALTAIVVNNPWQSSLAV